MIDELEILKIVGERLESVHVAFMLTGSFALGYYAKPRMTRDLDFVVALTEPRVSQRVQSLSPDFYVDEDEARTAIKTRRMFNLMHLGSGIKIDLIVLQDSPYRQAEFARRKPIELAGVPTWIVSREDLILSKLVWAGDAHSELQMRDHCSMSGSTGPTWTNGLPNWGSARCSRRSDNERYLPCNGEDDH